MSSDTEPDLERTRAEMIARMKARVDDARARGLSPEAIQQEVLAEAGDEIREQLPRVVERARSWWAGLRRLMVIGALAFGAAVAVAWLVEHRHAAPLCEQYAAQKGLSYRGLQYPVIGRSSSTSSQPRCILVNAAGRRDTVSLGTLEPNFGVELLVSFALQVELTTAAAFVLIALAASPFLRRI